MDSERRYWCAPAVLGRGACRGGNRREYSSLVRVRAVSLRVAALPVNHRDDQQNVRDVNDRRVSPRLRELPRLSGEERENYQQQREGHAPEVAGDSLVAEEAAAAEHTHVRDC